MYHIHTRERERAGGGDQCSLSTRKKNSGLHGLSANGYLRHCGDCIKAFKMAAWDTSGYRTSARGHMTREREPIMGFWGSAPAVVHGTQEQIPQSGTKPPEIECIFSFSVPDGDRFFLWGYLDNNMLRPTPSMFLRSVTLCATLCAGSPQP